MRSRHSTDTQTHSGLIDFVEKEEGLQGLEEATI